MEKILRRSKQTEEICLEAVRQNGLALEYVHEEFKTEELCLEAVKGEGCALQYVPEKLITKYLCFDAVKKMAGHCNMYRKNLERKNYVLKQ